MAGLRPPCRAPAAGGCFVSPVGTNHHQQLPIDKAAIGVVAAGDGLLWPDRGDVGRRFRWQGLASFGVAGPAARRGGGGEDASQEQAQNQISAWHGYLRCCHAVQCASARLPTAFRASRHARVGQRGGGASNGTRIRGIQHHNLARCQPSHARHDELDLDRALMLQQFLGVALR